MSQRRTALFGTAIATSLAVAAPAALAPGDNPPLRHNGIPICVKAANQPCGLVKRPEHYFFFLGAAFFA